MKFISLRINGKLCSDIQFQFIRIGSYQGILMPSSKNPDCLQKAQLLYELIAYYDRYANVKQPENATIFWLYGM